MPRSEFEGLVPFLQPKSLPSTIRGTHSWTFKLLDVRRKSVLGHDGRTVAGVHTRSETLPGFPSNEISSVFTRVVASAEAGVEEIAEEGEDFIEEPAPIVDKSSGMPMATSEYLGWRTSYRTLEPEVMNLPKTSAKLKKKSRWFNHLALPEASRAMAPQSEESRAQTAAGKRQRSVAESAYMRSLRDGSIVEIS